jgi:hypothetical protein
MVSGRNGGDRIRPGEAPGVVVLVNGRNVDDTSDTKR